MQFRWIALLSLWTLLSGPILAIPLSKDVEEPVVSSSAGQSDLDFRIADADVE